MICASRQVGVHQIEGGRQKNVCHAYSILSLSNTVGYSVHLSHIFRAPEIRCDFDAYPKPLNISLLLNLISFLDGKSLIAGTEENALLIFDPLNHQLVDQIDDAHENSINCIKFLDSNLFATCSNDKKIALWDLRSVKHKLKSLANGHSHFIKNIEYDPNLKYFISSGFDGAVNVWDLNNSSDQLESDFIRER